MPSFLIIIASQHSLVSFTHAINGIIIGIFRTEPLNPKVCVYILALVTLRQLHLRSYTCGGYLFIHVFVSTVCLCLY